MQPKFRRLVLAYPDAQHVLMPFEVDADGHVGGLVDDCAVLLDLKVDRIEEDDCADGLQRAVLPFLDERDDLVGDVGSERRGNLDAVELLQMVLDVAGRDALGVHSDNLILNTGNIALILLHDSWLKFTVTIARNLDVDIAVLRTDRLLAIAIAAVGRLFVLHIVLGVTKGRIQLRVQHLLDRLGEKFLQRRLDIVNRLHVLFLDPLLQLLFGHETHVFSQPFICLLL